MNLKKNSQDMSRLYVNLRLMFNFEDEEKMENLGKELCCVELG